MFYTAPGLMRNLCSGCTSYICNKSFGPVVSDEKISKFQPPRNNWTAMFFARSIKNEESM
jgi:hypothetical protein